MGIVVLAHTMPIVEICIELTKAGQTCTTRPAPLAMEMFMYPSQILLNIF